MILITLILCTLPVLMTLMPLIRKDAWWIRIFDFPRTQILSVCLIAWWFCPSDQISGAVVRTALLICICLQIVRIMPYTPLAVRQVKSYEGDMAAKDHNLRLLVANVLMTNRRADDLLAVVEACDPDIFITLETDKWWEDKLSALESRYPNTVKVPLDNLYGMHFYTRLTALNTEVRYLIEQDIPSIKAVVEMKSGHQVDIFALHPKPPAPGESRTSTNRDAELLQVGRQVKAAQRTTIVAGDLNDVAWSYTTRLFQRISGLLDPRIGRGMFNTFHAGLPFLRFPLDHVFHTPDFQVEKICRMDDFGSDHFPLFVSLQHIPKAVEEHEPPTPTEEDLKLADHKIRKGDGD